MRKTILILVGCAAAIVVLVVAIWRGSGSPPVDQAPLDVQTVRYDFGRVRAGTVVHHDFDMTNDGSEPKLIASVSTTCSCTTVPPMGQVIAPHSSLKLPVDVSVKGDGLFETKVFAAFKDQSSFVGVLAWRGVLQVPSELDFGLLEPGQAAEKKFSVRSVTSQPLAVKSVKCDNPNFEASVGLAAASTEPADPQIVVRFHPAPSATGKISAQLQIETDDTVLPVKVVAVQAQIQETGKK